MKKSLLVLAVLCGLCIHAMAYDTTPLQISIWPNRLQVVPDEIDVSGLKLNLPYGRNNRIEGVDLGIASSSMNASALQINLLNLTKEQYKGLQIGLANFAGASSGVCIGVLMNSTDSIHKGLQVGIVNTALETSGVQIGLVNYTSFMVGFQIGIVNIIRESVIPFFPIVNFCF